MGLFYFKLLSSSGQVGLIFPFSLPPYSHTNPIGPYKILKALTFPLSHSPKDIIISTSTRKDYSRIHHTDENLACGREGRRSGGGLWNTRRRR
ncbi:hypothetical protein YC2023_039571 [Brassica napus]